MNLNDLNMPKSDDTDVPAAKDSPAQPKAKAPAADKKAIPASQSFTKDSPAQARPAGRAYDQETDTEVSSHPSTGGEADMGHHEEERASKHTKIPQEIKARKDALASDKC